jgi:hypothetical protein
MMVMMMMRNFEWVGAIIAVHVAMFSATWQHDICAQGPNTLHPQALSTLHLSPRPRL